MQRLSLFGLDIGLLGLFKFGQGEEGLRRWRIPAVAAGVIVKSAFGETFYVFSDGIGECLGIIKRC